MKKYIITFLLFITLYAVVATDVKADSTDYTTFVEIIMPTGKLLSNFTDEEYEEYYSKVRKPKFGGVQIYEVNSNVNATYMSSTLYAINNNSNSDVKYQLDVVYETTNKVSFSTSGSVTAGVSGSFAKAIKSEVSSKVGVELSDTSTSSKKQTEKLDVVVEKNSRMIIYLDGNILVSNGVITYYFCNLKLFEGGYEVTVLQNQYVRLEKCSI